MRKSDVSPQRLAHLLEQELSGALVHRRRRMAGVPEQELLFGREGRDDRTRRRIDEQAERIRIRCARRRRHDDVDQRDRRLELGYEAREQTHDIALNDLQAGETGIEQLSRLAEQLVVLRQNVWRRGLL